MTHEIAAAYADQDAAQRLGARGVQIGLWTLAWVCEPRRTILILKAGGGKSTHRSQLWSIARGCNRMCLFRRLRRQNAGPSLYAVATRKVNHQTLPAGP